MSHYLRTVFSFVFFGIGGGLLSCLLLPVVSLVTRERELATRRCQQVLRWGLRVFFYVLAKLRLFKTAWPLVESVAPAQPCVIVCNHPCLLDTLVMMVRFRHVVCLVKQSYYDNPLIFGLAKLCGYIPAGHNGSIRGHERMLNEALDRLARGYSILAFPECRRSTLVGRLPFRRGPFEIAARAGVPVVPVQIACSPRTLAREIPLHRMPLECAHYSMREFPPQTVPQGRTATKTATQTIQDLLQPVTAATSPHAG